MVLLAILAGLAVVLFLAGIAVGVIATLLWSKNKRKSEQQKSVLDNRPT